MADRTQPAAAGKGTTAGDDMEALKADMAALKRELDTVVKAIKDLGDTAVAAAKRQQGAAVEHLAAEVQSLAAEAGERGRTQVAEIEQRIRAQPLAAVGIAFLAGLLFGGLRR